MSNPRNISSVAWPDDFQNHATPPLGTPIPRHDESGHPADDPPADRTSGVRRAALPCAVVDDVEADLSWDPRRDQ